MHCVFQPLHQGNLVIRESKGRFQATTNIPSQRKNALGKQWREARCFLFSAAFLHLSLLMP
jgi:hypothetical protein